jgi:hypothetical protein
MIKRISLAAAGAVLPLLAVAPSSAHADTARNFTVQHETRVVRLLLSPGSCVTQRHHRRVYHLLLLNNSITLVGNWSTWRPVAVGPC